MKVKNCPCSLKHTSMHTTLHQEVLMFACVRVHLGHVKDMVYDSRALFLFHVYPWHMCTSFISLLSALLRAPTTYRVMYMQGQLHNTYT